MHKCIHSYILVTCVCVCECKCPYSMNLEDDIYNTKRCKQVLFLFNFFF